MLSGWLLAAEELLRGRTTKVDPAQARCVLILEYRLPLGCLVHMTPVFEAMKRSRPELQIAVATRGLGLQVLRHSPFIDHLMDVADPTTNLTAAVRGLRKELRAQAFQPDCVLTGASDQRTRIALMALFGADAWRAGYTLQPALYQRALTYDPSLSLIRNNLRLARLVGCDADVTRPRVFFSEQDAATASSLLHEANPDARPILVMATQNSGGQSVGWHTDRFVQVIAAAQQLGYAVIYIGTAAEAAAIDAIRQATGGVGISLAGRTSVGELAAVLAACDVMVTLDTGPMHVGRSVGVPMVILGPSWQKPLEWMPLDVENVRILRGAELAEKPQNYRFDEITADQVIAAFADLTSQYPASAAARELRLREGQSGVDHRAVR